MKLNLPKLPTPTGRTPEGQQTIQLPPRPPAPPTPPPPPQVATSLPPPEIPVPPPPPTGNPKVPENYEEYVEAALKARTGNQNFMTFWATMAQADAMNRIAESLSTIEDLMTPGHDGEPSSLSEQIADGVQMAVHGIKDDLLTLVPEPTQAVLAASWQENAEEIGKGVDEKMREGLDNLKRDLGLKKS